MNPETVKTSTVAAGGVLTSQALANINLGVAIAVGLATFVYVVPKALMAWQDWRERQAGRKTPQTPPNTD